MKRNSIVNDSLHGSIIITDLEKKLVSTTTFNRLHNISQNSTAYLTFPTNRTKRFEHSLGTMYLANLMFTKGIFNTNQRILKKFAESIKKELESTGIELDVLESNAQEYIDYVNLGFRRLDTSTDNLYLVIALQAVRFAALLHDIGHPPFSHVTEYAFKDIYNNIKEKIDAKADYTKLEKEFYDILNDLTIEGEHAIHEAFGNKVSEYVLESINVDEKFKSQYEATKKLTLRILKSSKKNKDNCKIPISLHNLISNPIDSDRMDYIFRDCINSGIDIGRIDFERLLSSMCLIESDDDFHFLIDLKFKADIEEYFYKRLEMYKKVVYHHRVVKTDKLLYDIVKYLINMNLNECHQMEKEITYLWRTLNIDSEGIDSMFQWDDGFLLNIIKQIHMSKPKGYSDEIKSKIKEFITNEKEYFSVIKTSYDYKLIERQLIAQSEDYSFTKLLMNNMDSKGVEEVSKLFYNSIEFDSETIRSFNDVLVTEGYENVIQELLVVPKKVSNGFSEGFKTYLRNNDGSFEIIPFNGDVSKIRMKLDDEVRDIQKLFLYARTKGNKELETEIASRIVKIVVNYLVEKVKINKDEVNGKLIAFDGPNGAGKSTMMKEVSEILRKEYKGYKIAVTKEPTSTQLGDFTRDISNVIFKEHLARQVNVDRMYHVEELEHLLKKNDIVLTDRYILSSYILQRVDGVNFSDLKKINENVSLYPDLQFVVNGDVDLIKNRISKRKFANRLEKDKTQEEVTITDQVLKMINKGEIKGIDNYELIVSSNRKEGDYFENSIKCSNIIKEYLQKWEK